MKRYDNYKDSGIEWLNELPIHWGISKVKFLFDIQKGKTPKNLLDKIDVDAQVYLAMDYLRGEPKQTFFVSNKENVVVVDENETLILWDGSNAGEFIKSKKGVLSSTMAVIKSKKVDNKFQWYSFKSFESILKDSCNGMGIPHVDGKFFKGSAFAVPPIEEQTTIANYLDQKTTQIDDLIAKKERLIQLLEEERTAIINQAVTKGLDPTVPMKDSGIEWLGEIPAHWEVKKLKYIKSTEKNAFVDGPFGSNLKTEHFIENGDVYVIDSGYITSGEFKIKRGFKTISLEHFETVKRSECRARDIIIAKIGANFGMSGILPELDKPSLVSGNTLKLTIDENYFDLEFIHLQLLNLKTSGEIDLLVKGSAQPALSMGVMSELPFVIPKNKEEQILVREHIKTNHKRIDNLISKVSNEIELLKEYKTALISEVVTGKVDVREEIIN